VLVVFEGDFDEVEVRGPAGEDDALDGALVGVVEAPLAVLFEVVEEGLRLGGRAVVAADFLCELGVLNDVSIVASVSRQM
jgi:hypothetical protein